MSEIALIKKLKTLFWGSLLIQIIIGAAWVIYTGGTMNASVSSNTEDIKALKTQLSQKADIQMVLRIKGDQDRVQQMILDNTKDLKTGQAQLMEALINHISKESK